MTSAICIFCGSMKVGAWTPCDACAQVPSSESEWIKALACSDKYHDPEMLQRLAAHVRLGGEVAVDEPTKASILQLLRSVELRTLAQASGVTLPASAGLDAQPARSQTPRRPWEFWKRSPEESQDFKRTPVLDTKRLDSASDGQNRLWTFIGDPPCGTVRFDDSGKAVIVGNEHDSPLHALMHIRLRTLPQQQLLHAELPGILRQLETWAGVENRQWTRMQEELVVRQMELYGARLFPALRDRVARPLEPVSPDIEPVLAVVFRLGSSKN